jgi:hypothetical protein
MQSDFVCHKSKVERIPVPSLTLSLNNFYLLSLWGTRTRLSLWPQKKCKRANRSWRFQWWVSGCWIFVCFGAHFPSLPVCCVYVCMYVCMYICMLHCLESVPVSVSVPSSCRTRWRIAQACGGCESSWWWDCHRGIRRILVLIESSIYTKSRLVPAWFVDGLWFACHVCMYVFTDVCMYVCMYLRMYVCMHVCIYVCMHVCMYSSMYVCHVNASSRPYCVDVALIPNLRCLCLTRLIRVT